MATADFAVHFSDARIHDAVRDAAAHAHVSPTTFVEQAVLNDLLLRGELHDDDLRVVADRLTSMTTHEYHSAVRRSLLAFRHGEHVADPVEDRHVNDVHVEPPSRSGALRTVARFRHH